MKHQLFEAPEVKFHWTLDMLILDIEVGIREDGVLIGISCIRHLICPSHHTHSGCRCVMQGLNNTLLMNCAIT